jgi:hypothetical protein
MVQTSQTVACNRRHDMYKRLARCSGSDLAELAHEFLGQMLGAPRTMRHFGSRVLQDAGLIEYPRGHVTIIDRKGLEAVACECRGMNLSGSRSSGPNCLSASQERFNSSFNIGDSYSLRRPK